MATSSFAHSLLELPGELNNHTHRDDPSSTGWGRLDDEGHGRRNDNDDDGDALRQSYNFVRYGDEKRYREEDEQHQQQDQHYSLQAFQQKLDDLTASLENDVNFEQVIRDAKQATTNSNNNNAANHGYTVPLRDGNRAAAAAARADGATAAAASLGTPPRRTPANPPSQHQQHQRTNLLPNQLFHTTAQARNRYSSHGNSHRGIATTTTRMASSVPRYTVPPFNTTAAASTTITGTPIPIGTPEPPTPVETPLRDRNPTLNNNNDLREAAAPSLHQHPLRHLRTTAGASTTDTVPANNNIRSTANHNTSINNIHHPSRGSFANPENFIQQNVGNPIGSNNDNASVSALLEQLMDRLDRHEERIQQLELENQQLRRQQQRNASDDGTVMMSPGTRFVAELAQVMDLPEENYAPLSRIMDIQLERLILEDRRRRRR